MEKQGKHKKDRNFLTLLRQSPGGVLPHNLSVLYFLLTGSILLPVLLVFPTCTELPDENRLDEPKEIPSEAKFNILTRIEDSKYSFKIKKRNFYVFSAEDFRELVACTDTEGIVKLSEGEYDIVAIANSQGEMDTSVIKRYETMELLTCILDAEDHSSPMCSGKLHLSVHSDTSLHIEVVPMISKVVLVKVENNLGGNKRVEDPYIYLTQVNGQAEIMRYCGFRPSEFTRNGEISYIDDIGINPAYPEIPLYCYPNESSGPQSTGIVFDCKIEGKRYKMSSSVPPISRNSTIYADIVINSAEDYKWNFNE